MFEQASRINLHVPTSKGLLPVSTLWGLPLIDDNPNKLTLDGIAIDLSDRLTKETKKSFVTEETQENRELQLSFDIVKHIIGVKLKEQKENTAAKILNDRRQKILAAMARKEEEELSNLSVDEMKSMLESIK